MDLNSIRYFIAVSNSKSMLEATENIYVSQSTLSLAIKKLESELGTSLFDRRGKSKLQLTPDGEYFLRETSRIVEELDEVVSTLQNNRQLIEDTVIVANEVPDFFNEVMRVLYEFHPEIILQNIRPTRSDAKRLILSNQVDISITQQDDAFPNMLYKEVLHDKMVLLVNPKESLASKKAVTVEELCNSIIVVQKRGFSNYELVDSYFRQRGITFFKTYEVGAEEAIPQALEQGGGCAFFPSSVIDFFNVVDYPVLRNLKTVPFKNDECMRTIRVGCSMRREKKSSVLLVYNYILRFGEYTMKYGRYPSIDDWPKNWR